MYVYKLQDCIFLLQSLHARLKNAYIFEAFGNTSHKRLTLRRTYGVLQKWVLTNLLTGSIKDATKIYRDEFQTVKQSASLKINMTIYVTLYILFILMLALIKSFISRNYKLYKSTFDILVFHGFNFKIATLILTFMLLLSFVLAYIISTLLLHEVNAIFNLYYVDLIRLNFEYIYIVGFFAMGIVASYLYELKALSNIINKAKGR